MSKHSQLPPAGNSDICFTSYRQGPRLLSHFWGLRHVAFGLNVHRTGSPKPTKSKGMTRSSLDIRRETHRIVGC